MANAMISTARGSFFFAQLRLRVVAPLSTRRPPAGCSFLSLHPPCRRLSHSAPSGVADACAPRDVQEATAERGDETAGVQDDDKGKVKVSDGEGDGAASPEHEAVGMLVGLRGPTPPRGPWEGIGGRGGIVHAPCPTDRPPPPPIDPPPPSSSSSSCQQEQGDDDEQQLQTGGI